MATATHHTAEHYRFLPSGHVVFVHGYDASHASAGMSRPAKLHERSAILDRPNGRGSIRSTNAEDARELRGRAALLGIPYTMRRAGGNHHGRQGAYDHLDFATREEAEKVLAAAKEGHPAPPVAVPAPPVPPVATPAPATPPVAAQTGTPGHEETTEQFHRIFGDRLEAPAPDAAEIGSDFDLLFGALPAIAPTEYTATAEDVTKLKVAGGFHSVRFDEDARAMWNQHCKVDPRQLGRG